MAVDFDLEGFLPYRLNRAAETISRAFASIYKDRYRMTRPEWRVLALLGADGRMTATEIARRSGMHKTKVSRAVGALEKRRWLKRAEEPADRRVERLELTPAGRIALDELTLLARDYQAGLQARFGPEGVAALDRALDAIETALPDRQPGA